MIRRIFLAICLFHGAAIYGVQSTVLTHSTVLTGTTKLGITYSNGWTYQQDTDNFWQHATHCSLGTSCTITTLATVAKSIRAMSITTGNNLTITHVCEGAACSGTNNGWTGVPSLSLVLTAVNGAGVFTFSTPNIAASQLVGTSVTTTGFVNGGNNLTGTITANTTTTFTVSATTTVETHAGTGSISDPAHVTNSGNDNEDAWYSTSGATGITSYTVTISGTPTSFFDLDLVEWVPPSCGGSPCAASLDGVGTNFSSNCNTTCGGGTPSVTGTDVILEFVDTANPVTAQTSPWFLNTTGNLMGLNVTSSPPLTVTIQLAGFFTGIGLSFKSSLGTFPPSTPQIWTQVNNNDTATGQGMQFNAQSCSPTCSLTVQSTGAGDLLVLLSASGTNGHSISSVSGGGTWVVPSGANTCAIGNATVAGQLSCAYVLSSTSGTTSVTVTTAATGTYYFNYYEISKSNGSITLDVQNSAFNSSATATPSGVTATPTGLVDVVFQMFYGDVGTACNTLTAQYYPLPGANAGWGSSGGGPVAMGAVNIFNTPSIPTPVWLNTSSLATVVSMISFK